MAIENVYMDWGTWLYSDFPHGGDTFMNLSSVANVLMHFSPRAFANSIVSVNFHFKVDYMDQASQRFDSLYPCVRPAALAGADLYSSGISNWQSPGATGLPDDIAPNSDMIYVPSQLYITMGWNSVPIVALTAFQQMMSGLRQVVMFSGYPFWVKITKTELPYFEIEYRSNAIGGIQIF